MAGVRDGGVRVGSYTREGVRVKEKTLVHVRAARSMVERSLLTCLSILNDVHPRLVSGIGRYRATTHNITTHISREVRSSGVDSPHGRGCTFNLKRF